ncbi:hypothetical protein NC652_031296 [Populus alba x Populus x berolinensis]|nr:hypothetical protein NC652_031296 [Populus alba x Populus x berolinensis]
MSDGPGLVQFMAATPTEREVAGYKSSILTHDHLAHRSFFFSPSDITALRRLVPPHLSHCSSFKILTACVWICRTIALQPDPNEEMRIICLVNAREKFNPPSLPRGYYGNGIHGYVRSCKEAIPKAMLVLQSLEPEVILDLALDLRLFWILHSAKPHAILSPAPTRPKAILGPAEARTQGYLGSYLTKTKCYFRSCPARTKAILGLAQLKSRAVKVLTQPEPKSILDST